MIKLFAFKSKLSKDRAIYPAETSAEAFLHFITDILIIFHDHDTQVSTLESYDLVPTEVNVNDE